HRPQGNHVFIAPRIAHYAHRFHRQENGKCLTGLVIPIRPVEFVNKDGVGLYGIVVSSQAQRLKPHAIDVRVKTDPVRWFLDGKDDVRSSYYLEDVATEFQVQGLELDWACVVWDGDLRHDGSAWSHHEFKGSRWQKIRKEERQAYLKNAYRVLMTRARQGMVLVIPEGSDDDPTRDPGYYDNTFSYLSGLGIPIL